MNGNGFWSSVAKWLAGVLSAMLVAWVGCQQSQIAQQGTKDAKQDEEIFSVTTKVYQHETELKNRQQYIDRLQDLEKFSNENLHRLDIRLLRLEMKMDQLLVAEGVPLPRGLPPVPKKTE